MQVPNVPQQTLDEKVERLLDCTSSECLLEYKDEMNLHTFVFLIFYGTVLLAIDLVGRTEVRVKN